MGMQVRDVVTGFKGVVVAETHWLNGCTRVQVQPRPKKGENSVPGAESFDVEQLEVVNAAPVRLPRQKPERVGMTGGGGRKETPRW